MIRKPEAVIVKGEKSGEAVEVSRVNEAERSRKKWRQKDYISFSNLEFIGDFSESNLSGMVQLEIRLLRLKDKMEYEKLEMDD